MTPCLTENTLGELVEERLERSARQRALAHMDGCAECRSQAAALLASFRPPEQFDGYRVLQPLGQGESGDVYRAYDARLDRQVAIKFLRGLVLDERRRERFAVEARTLARLRLPGVVQIFRAGEVDGCPYLVLELVEGTGLDQAPRPLAFSAVLPLAIRLTDALMAAHQSGIIHRDIKPANVMLLRDGDVRLLDFGLARLESALEITEGPLGPQATSPLVTRTGQVLGTPLYMAPEQWQGLPITARSDLYALGVLLYELCAGRTPHQGSSVEGLRESVLGRPAPPLRQLAPWVPRRFAQAVDSCLQADPTRRCASAAHLLRELRACRRRTLRWPSAAVLALGLGAALLPPPPAPTAGGPASLQAGLARSTLLRDRGELAEARRVLSELRRLPPPLGDDPRIDIDDEMILRTQGDYEAARAAAERARGHALTRGDRYLAAEARMHEGWCLLALGRPAEAEAALSQALPVLQAMEAWQDAAWALLGMARVQLRRGALRGALRSHEAQLEILRRTRAKQATAYAFCYLSQVLLRLGRTTEAAARVAEGLALCQDISARECQQEGLWRLADVYLAMGKAAEARHLLEGELARLPAGDITAASLGLSLGRSLQLLGERGRARRLFEDAIAGADRGRLRHLAAEGRLALGELLLEEGRPREADVLLQQAAEQFHAGGAPDDEARAGALRARALLRQGDRPAASQVLQAAQRRAGESEDVGLRAAVAESAAEAR